MDHQFRLAEIEVNKATMDEKIIGLFRYESEAHSKRHAAMVILVEITSTLYIYEQLLDVINATAEQARHLTAGFEGDPIVRFEKLIQRLNEAITHFVQQAPTPLAWNRLNVFVLEFSDNHVCLSGIGRLTNALLQKQPDGQFRSFDLFGSLEQPLEVNPEKPFASLICGDIHPGDVLFFGTQNFERLRDELQLLPRLMSLPAVSAALEIKQELERRNVPDDFAGVIVVNAPLPQPAAARAATPLSETETPAEKSTQSIQKMYQEEEETQAMLSPSIPLANASKNFFDVKKWYARFVERILTIWQDWRASRKTHTSVRDPMAMASLRSLHAGHGSFMTKKRKWSFVFGAAALLVMTGGTLLYRHARIANAEQALWMMAHDQALDKKNRAEADLVYGNEEQARRLLKEANEILASLNEKTKARKQTKAELQKNLQDIQLKLRREKKLDRLTEIATLPDGNLLGLTTFNEQVYLAEKNGSAVWRVNPTTKEIKRIPLSFANPSSLAAITPGKESVVLLTEDRNLHALNPTNEQVTPLSFAANRAKSLTSFIFYNRRLYGLDPTSNMIWKYSPTDEGFTQESAYLKQNTNNLMDAISMAIDSNIYVGFKEGKILRFLSGVEDPWNAPLIDPPLTSLGGMWTDIDTDRLVLTDPQGKRVIVVRKDGHLIAQFISPEFQNPREVSGDLKNKKLYVLDGQRVVMLEMP